MFLTVHFYSPLLWQIILFYFILLIWNVSTVTGHHFKYILYYFNLFSSFRFLAVHFYRPLLWQNNLIWFNFVYFIYCNCTVIVHHLIWLLFLQFMFRSSESTATYHNIIQLSFNFIVIYFNLHLLAYTEFT